MIVCDCLHKKFGTVTAVDGVSMEIKDGTFLGLLGPNGAGKTTLMRMMTGLLMPDTGTVMFDGQPMDRNAVAVKQAIGAVSYTHLRGIPFAAGILHENDIDYPVAKALAAEVVSEAPFELIKEGTYERAAALLESCKRVICCIKDFGPVNEKNRGLAELGKHKEKII